MLTLPELPYPYDALEPVMSAETLRFHHDKHHATYIEKANALAQKAGLRELALEDLICKARDTGNQQLFNNAAQAWNHAFFWQSMTPQAGKPAGELAKAIDASFGSMDDLKQKFVEEGANHFASGWVWLIQEGDKGLAVISTHDADDTFTKSAEFPLLTCDLWEHAYYLDFKNDRKAFLTKWFDKLANWSFAGGQFEARTAGRHGYRFPTMAAV